MSIHRQRRSRFSRVSAGRQAPTTSADRPNLRFPETRIQNNAARHFVGIALEKQKMGMERVKSHSAHIKVE